MPSIMTDEVSNGSLCHIPVPLSSASTLIIIIVIIIIATLSVDKY